MKCAPSSMTPLISIVIATYNRVDLLKIAMESVFNQTYPNFEVIVVDDGSTDGTPAFLRSVSDKRLVFMEIEHQGRSFARNQALLRAKGEFITFLDSDDIYLPNKLEIQLEFIQSNPALSVVYSSADVFLGQNSNNILMRYVAECEGDVYKNIAFFFPNPICLPTVFMKKEVVDVVGLFDTELNRFEDTDYWRRIAKLYNFGAIKESTCLIRTHEGNEIRNLDLTLLANQVIKYSRKVIREDFEMQGKWLFSGAAILLKNYSKAISKNRRGRIPGIKLASQAKFLKALSKL